MNKEGKLGGGWHAEGLGGEEERLGKLATVWDGEVVGMRGTTVGIRRLIMKSHYFTIVKQRS